MRSVFSRALCVACLALCVRSYSLAQLVQPHGGDATIILTPLVATPPITASVDVYGDCSKPPYHPSLLDPNQQNAVLGPGQMSLRLASRAVAGTTICAVETFNGQGAPAPQIFPTPPGVLYVAANSALPAPAESPTLKVVYTEDADVYVNAVPSDANYTASLEVFKGCDPAVDNLCPALAGNTCGLKGGISLRNPAFPALVDVEMPGQFVDIRLLAKATKGAKLCVQENFTPKAAAPARGPLYSNLVTVVDPPALTTSFRNSVPLFAAIAGADVSGASSTDPQAIFHGSAFIDFPLKSGSNWVEQTLFWLGGQVRFTGISQPADLTASVGDLGSTETYLATAVNAAPQKIVQSIEASVNASYRLANWKPSGPTVDSFDVGNRPADDVAENSPAFVTLSLLASGGAITPASPAQANPPVYVVTNQIYNQYANSIPLPASCNPMSVSPAPMTCYIAFIPEARSRFYRHYEGGFRMKTYGRDFLHGEYRFPAVVDLTFGQNEFVTAGHLSRIVMHLGGIVPIPQVDGVYLFGSMDLALSPNTSSPQLLLTPAPSNAMLTYNSPGVYSTTISQPDRDRYMVGFGVDLYHLIPALIKKGSSGTAGQPAAAPK